MGDALKASPIYKNTEVNICLLLLREPVMYWPMHRISL